jgi:L-ascorbate metabolism protein UlaG (beta-lactamase superfamily)
MRKTRVPDDTGAPGATYSRTPILGDNSLKVTFFGTTTLLFDDGRDQVLFDAHMTRPSLLKYICGSDVTDTRLVEDMLALHRVNRLRGIFISHTHHDHVMDAPFIARKTGATIYGSSSAMNVARGGDVPEAQLVRFQPNETYRVGGYMVTVIPSIHSKPTILNNDLGQTIDTPLRQPARLRSYKEGGSYDFYVQAEGKRFMIMSCLMRMWRRSPTSCRAAIRRPESSSGRRSS